MKPLIIGMNNPLSDDPEYDLYPYPEGSTGWRLWKMLPEGKTRRQYLEAFDRRNLLRARTWDAAAARDAGRELRPALDGRCVVVLGTQVRAALGLPPSEPLTWLTAFHIEEGRRFHWLPFPHPSGRNRWFNDVGNQQQARDVLAKLMSYAGAT